MSNKPKPMADKGVRDVVNRLLDGALDDVTNLLVR